MLSRRSPLPGTRGFSAGQKEARDQLFGFLAELFPVPVREFLLSSSILMPRYQQYSRSSGGLRFGFPPGLPRKLGRAFGGSKRQLPHISRREKLTGGAGKRLC